MTTSSAWLGAGVLLIAMGLLTLRQRGGLIVLQKKRPVPPILVMAGVVLLTMTMAGLLLPMGVDLGGFSFTGSGIRPAIWANLVGTLLTTSVLLLVAREGLSRGVLVVDFLLLTALTILGRVSFRFLDDTKDRWSSEGTPVAFVGRVEDAELVFRAVRSFDSPRLRPVAVVDRRYGSDKGRFQGYPLFGGSSGMDRAVRECGLHAVVLVDRGQSGEGGEFLGDYVRRNGALDVFKVGLSLGPSSLEGGAGK